MWQYPSTLDLSTVVLAKAEVAEKLNIKTNVAGRPVVADYAVLITVPSNSYDEAEYESFTQQEEQCSLFCRAPHGRILVRRVVPSDVVQEINRQRIKSVKDHEKSLFRPEKRRNCPLVDQSPGKQSLSDCQAVEMNCLVGCLQVFSKDAVTHRDSHSTGSESNERDVMNLHANVEERMLWTAYPSWRQFTWLYFFSLMTGLRGLLFYVFAISGWESWFGGTALLLLVPVCLRRWAVYSITSRRLLVKNGYTGREIVTMPLERVGEVSIKQGPIARVTGIGTVVVRDANGAELLRFHGIAEPDVIKTRILALKPRAETQRVAP